MTANQGLKLVCVALYGIIVAVLTIAGRVYFGDGPHAEAAHVIQENQVIADTDLRPVDQKDISGHLARRGFAIGEKITARDVAPPATPPVDNTIAAVITMHRLSNVAAIEKGASVQICLDHKPFGKPSKVAMAICGDKNCLVTLPIGEWPAEAKATKHDEEAKNTKDAKQTPPNRENGGQPAAGAAEPKPLALPVGANRLSAVPEGEKCEGG